jgi:hypothetical protein
LNLFQTVKPLPEKNKIKLLENTLDINTIFKCTPILFSLKKELIYLECQKNRQFFFFAKEFYISLRNTILFLVKENLFTLTNKNLLLEKHQHQLFSNYITYILYKKDTPLVYLNSSSYTNKNYINSMQKSILKDNFNVLISSLNINPKKYNKNFILETYKYFNQEYTF